MARQNRPSRWQTDVVQRRVRVGAVSARDVRARSDEDLLSPWSPRAHRRATSPPWASALRFCALHQGGRCPAHHAPGRRGRAWVPHGEAVSVSPHGRMASIAHRTATRSRRDASLTCSCMRRTPIRVNQRSGQNGKCNKQLVPESTVHTRTHHHQRHGRSRTRLSRSCFSRGSEHAPRRRRGGHRDGARVYRTYRVDGCPG